MQFESVGRRSFLKNMGAAGMLSALPEAAFGLHAGSGHIAHEVAAPGAGLIARLVDEAASQCPGHIVIRL